MTNTKIKDMIETIEQFAQSQPDFPVYNILGEVHTYGDLKADSDSLAAKIDSLDIPEKSPVVVYGGQEYEMLATFVALTKSGHAYIPIDSHSALERVTAIVEVAEPSLIIAINDFPLEDVQAPILTLDQVTAAFESKTSYEVTHPVKGDDTYYIIFTSGTTGKPKGVQISHNNLLSFTNWMITDKEFATPTRPQMLAQPPYSFDLSVMYWAPTLALGGTLYALPSAITQDFKKLFETIFSLPIAIWTSTPSFADMAMLSEDFNAEKMPEITHFYFDGEELTVKTAQKLRQRFPEARIINAYGPTEATVALSAVAVTDEMLANLKRLPIGYTKEDSPTYIIDEDGNIKPEAQDMVMNDLKNHFRPEFLNRLDETIMFKPLTKANITNIIDLLVKDLNRRLADKELSVELTSAAKNYVADHGYEPMYGARPLKRYLQKSVETLAARLILSDGVDAEDTILIDVENDQLIAKVKF